MRRRVIVIGAGIAGLAIAERLQRFSETEVFLVERSPQLGCGSTMDQHGWFHAGSLYSLRGNAPTIEAAVNNLKALGQHYHSFIGSHATTNLSKSQWFVNSPVKYVFPNNCLDAEIGNGVNEFRNFVSYASKIAASEAEIASLQGRNRIPEYLTVSGADCPMRTPKILADLANSYVGNGGKILLNESFERVHDDGNRLTVLFESGKTITGDDVILAMGSESPAALAGDVEIEIRASPIMVVFPHLASESLVMVETRSSPSLSHILHVSSGNRYSVVSGGYSADLNDRDGKLNTAKLLVNATKRVFKHFPQSTTSRIYFGTKVDTSDCSGTRDYSPKIYEVGRKTLMCLPGKFSFSFLLADQVANKLKPAGIERAPCREVVVKPKLIARPRHEQISWDLFQQGRHESDIATNDSVEFQTLNPSFWHGEING